jgi:hypothetical protein
VDAGGGLFFHLQILTGDSTVNWKITIQGLVFFTKEQEGFIEPLTKKTIRFPFTLGLGPVDIMVTINDEVYVYSACMMGPFFFYVQKN